MKIDSILKVICLLLISAMFFSGCAKIVAPTGGPKDEEHPLIVEIDPPDKTVNFDSKKISITFNEFIQLKDLNNNLIISPPVEEKPDIKVKGKALVIEFAEELKDSTTYNIYFGNSVQDYNEGNPIENFQYVLSTGSYIDSLSIKGQVINSFNLLPEEGVFVMLYKDSEDSVPIKQIPDYISKTNEEGYFRINNIRENQYKLFCLRDLNKNYLFDLPSEEIAYTDSLIQFELVTHIHVDTIYKADSINIALNLPNGNLDVVDKVIDTI
ncbi:MAG: Ig-like domain-containing protein, partial [Bacteroidales bacterium]|nr:Ig-like domain-containing protein [Bacteroidales bacterium]